MTSPQPDAIKQLGALMCEATREILWASARGAVLKQNPGVALALRTGAGQATYHRFDPHRKHHLITYGAKMIAAKHQPETAQGWLSTREIQRRDYFGGEVSVVNLLAHTCCHEFAHLLQHSAGQRRYGSVHNQHFYVCLDKLHRTGAADATRTFLKDGALALGLLLPSAPFRFPHPGEECSPWQAGDLVLFGESKHEKRGQIIRVNRKTCTVAVHSPGRILRYRVPLHLLRCANTA
ncbi:hypothetical protein [Marinobacter daepoensis]